ncbi:MAG: hypothetical protein FWG39_03610 [Alphaproteobacteria bacterium]|nr:hypothetical protein [Alphaproteobacteria bacterium]
MKKISMLYALCSLLFVAGTAASARAADLTLYYSPGCPYCHYAMDFINDHLKSEFPDLNVTEVNVGEQANRAKFMDALKGCEIAGGGIPLIVIGTECLQGFGESTPDAIREAVKNAPEVPVTETVAEQQSETNAQPRGNISIFLIALAVITLVSMGIVLFARKKK